MLFIGALISAGVGLVGGGIAMLGANKAAKEQSNLAKEQMEEANKLRQEALDNRVDYRTPSEITDMLNTAKREAAQGSDLARSVAERADASLANRTQQIQRSATSGAQALAAIGAASDTATQDIASAEEKQLAIDESRKANVTQAQAVAAGFKDKEFDINVTAEFERVYGESEALKGASIQNRAAAIDSKAEGAAAIGKALGGAGKIVAENVDFGGGRKKRKTGNGPITV